MKFRTRVLAMALSVLSAASLVMHVFAQEEVPEVPLEVSEEASKEASEGSLAIVIENEGGCVTATGSGGVYVLRKENGTMKVSFPDGSVQDAGAGPFVLTEAAGVAMHTSAQADPGFLVSVYRIQADAGTFDAVAEPSESAFTDAVIGEGQAVLTVCFLPIEDTPEEDPKEDTAKEELPEEEKEAAKEEEPFIEDAAPADEGMSLETEPTEEDPSAVKETEAPSEDPDADAPEEPEAGSEPDTEKEPAAGDEFVRSGITAGRSWVEMANGDIVMEDGTVYTPVYPSPEAVAKRQAEAAKASPASGGLLKAPVMRKAAFRLAAAQPSEAPESFAGEATVTWRDNGSESYTFGLGAFSGIPESATSSPGTVYVYCADATAAAPYEGMVCSYTATLTNWDETTGTATYSLYATPPGATDGVSANEFGLMGYQHLAGDMSITFDVSGSLYIRKVSSDASVPMGNGYYSFEGVSYGLYSDAACTVEETELTCDAASGISNSVTVKKGVYYLKEKTAGKGLVLNSEVITVTVESGGESEVEVSDAPLLTCVNVQKKSANPAMTDGNACYSLAGAKYAVYKTWADADAKTNAVTEFATDASGYGESSDALYMGETYYVREISAPTGGTYDIDPSVYTVKTKEKEAVTKETAAVSTEIPANDPAAIVVEKVSSDGTAPKDGKSLAGTQFTIRYYKGSYTASSLPSSPDKTWVLEVKKQSDGAYRTFLLPSYKVSGDDFYYLSGNPDPVLPLGTVTIEETKAAEGYRLENTYRNGSASGTGVFVGVIKKNGDAVQLTYQNTAIAEAGFTALDTPVAGGVKIKKMDADLKEAIPQGDASLKDAVFEIVNDNDYAVTVKGKSYKKGETVMTIKTDKDGLAATGASDLPYGAYTIREKEGGAPTGYVHEGTLSRTVSIKEDGKIVDMTGAASSILNKVIRGGIKVQKTDAESETAAPQGDASLEGAVFAVINQSAGPVVVGGVRYGKGSEVLTITTNAEGIASSKADDLPYGTYEIREKAPSKGYLLNESWSRTFTIREDKKIVELLDTPVSEEVIRGGVSVEKMDKELAKGEDLGGASLSGIEFVITNASKEEVISDGKTYAPGESVLCIFTDKEGHAKTDADALPYGTYTIAEVSSDEQGISANDSYLCSDKTIFTFEIREDGVMVSSDKNGKEVAFYDQVKRNDLSFRKVEDGSDRPMGLIPFVIENVETGEKHVVVTDGNGTFSSSKHAHSRSTNANDAVLDGYTEETVLTADQLDDKAGSWFGLGQGGTMAEADDALPAFPYGPYRLTELRCEENEGYELIKNYPFTVDEDVSETGGEPVSLYNLHNIPILPEIKTKAIDDKTGEHAMLSEKEASLTDTVSAKNLQKGKDYVLCATLMDAETENALRIPDADGSRLKVTGEAAFTAMEGSMEIPVPITLDASTLAGRKVVVYEVLYLADEDGNRTEVASHKEIADADQTLTIPDLHTTFTDGQTGSQIGTISGTQTVSDTVYYTGLTPGKEVTIHAMVMTTDEAGNAVALTDGDGNIQSKTVIFTPGKSDGSVKVEFTIDSRLLAGKKAVCFEEVRYGKIPVAIHADIEDKDQTLWYPTIRTTAKDKASGGHTASVSESGIFIDTVSYCGLKPGDAYTAKAVLMDADTGEAIVIGGKTVTAEKTFTPKMDTGSVDVEIPVDTTALAGKKTVVFEELYTGSGEEERLVAEHKNLEDTDQQVVVPDIRTTLTDEASGTHAGSFGEKVKLTDTVSYTGLLPGKEYRLEAQLMTADDAGKETEVSDAEGKPYMAETSFTAKEESGTATVIFTVDSRLLAGKKVVCFETLYMEDVKLVVHADINDEEQSVYFPAIRTSAKDTQTGLQISPAAANAVIKDTVTYTNLIPGQTYVVKGSLMDAETGIAVSAGFLKKVTAEAEFTPDTPDGSVELSFALDTEKLEGMTTVVFEELYLKTESGKEVFAAEHKDLSDADQQVSIPKLRTSASVSGEKECTAGKDTELIDAVTYSGLLAGRIYILKGKIVDKESGQAISVNGKAITGQQSFTAVSSGGTTDMKFYFDSTLLEGKTVVVFEDLYLTADNGSEIKIASHADVNDAEQSVRIKAPDKPKTPTVTPTPTLEPTKTPLRATSVFSPKTGDTSRLWLWILLLGGGGAGGAGLIIAKKKKKI